jgi:1-acyl-sn-glycerol-3-phosphate acyltransferase
MVRERGASSARPESPMKPDERSTRSRSDGASPIRRIARALARREERARIDRLRDAREHAGYDPFGMHPDWVGMANALLDPLYRYYFRVQAHGAEHLPARGPAILIANHSGTLPFDALMLCIDVARNTEPPRLLRPVADRFVARLPWAATIMARCGAIGGALSDVRYLLEHGELCLIFPEGLSAIGKPSTARYRLQPFHVGFAELALRHRVPIVPVAIIGPEEQWPVLAQLPMVHPYGLPYVPIVGTPLPLPVRYHVHYGSPLALDAPEDEPVTQRAIEAASTRAREALQALIERGVRERKGVFR